MSSVRASFIRGRLYLLHPKAQRRWARVHDVRFLATHRDPSLVQERYKDKLHQKAKTEGHKSLDQLREAYKEKIEGQRRQAISKSQPNISNEPSHSGINPPFQVPPPPPTPNSSEDASSKSPPGVKTLSSYLDVPKVMSLPEKEITTLWRLRHASSPTSLCATISLNTYQRIARTAKDHPQFILPLPREGQGAEIHFLQWTFPTPTTSTVLFTHLAEYKLRGEFASPHTTVTHHLDLADPKGLVLLNGDVVQDRGVSVDEGKWLLMCLQKFYAFEGEAEVSQRKRLLKQFSQGDETFKVEELMEEAERI